MASAHIKALIAPPSTADAEKRTLDFVNARFKTYQDLEQAEDFDALVEESVKHNADLKAKLSQSQVEVNTLIARTRSAAHEHLHTAQELSLLRHSLADELSYLSSELVSTLSGPEGKPTLLEDIETLHRNLKELQTIKGYVQVIEHAIKLRESTVSAAQSTPSPFDCITHYEELQRFVSSVTEVCSKAQDAAGQQKLHVVTALESIRGSTWGDIKATFTSALVSASEKLQWPMPVNYAAAETADRNAFEAAFYNLIRLQTIGDKLHASLEQERTEKDGLYPIQALVQPVSLRFKYHFEGTRQTNRLDKPEWYFTHILNAAHEHRAFMDTVIQQLLSSTEYKHIIAWREFTLLLLPLLSRKLRRTVPALIPHPPILAHTIYQALTFDTALREEGFELSGTSAHLRINPGMTQQSAQELQKWMGISEVILGKKEWFEAWMEGERAFAMDQYMDIISAPDAWLIAEDISADDEDAVIDRELKPANSARRVKALVEQVTDRYSPLPQFVQRTRFLITVQLPLLEQYHARISSSLDAYETLSSTFMRAVPGALADAGRTDSKRLTTGVEGVQRLCKALVSAKYLAAAMDAWGEDLFFLELWAEINHKALLRSRAQATALLPDPRSGEDEVPEGTIFEELVVQYGKLVGRAEDMIVHTVCGEVEAGLRAHFSAGGSSQPTPVATSDKVDDVTLAPTLLAPIALLSSQLSFLQSTLPQATVTSLYRRIASHLASHILQRAIMYRGRARVTPQEGKVILAECELWVETCRHALSRGPGKVEAPWRSLLQAARIVGAQGEQWGKIVEETVMSPTDQEWEAKMLSLVGFAELSREEVTQIIQTRTDCTQ